MDYDIKYTRKVTLPNYLETVSGVAQNEAKYLLIDVPNHTNLNGLRLETSGTTGSMEIYGKAGSRPSWTDYDYQTATGDDPMVTSITAGTTQYLMFRGTSAGNSSTDVKVRFRCGGGEAIWPDSDGMWGVFVSANYSQNYTFHVPGGSSDLQIDIPIPAGVTDQTECVVTEPDGTSHDVGASGGSHTYNDPSPAAGCWTITLTNNSTSNDWITDGAMTIFNAPSPTGSWSTVTEASGTWSWQIQVNP
jgi:hypothetical protein